MTDLTRIQELAGFHPKKQLIAELKRSKEELAAAHDLVIKQVQNGAQLDEGLFNSISAALKTAATIGQKGAAAIADKTRQLSSGIKNMYLDHKAQGELRELIDNVKHLNKVLGHVERESPTILSRDSEVKTVMGLLKDVMVKLIDQLTARLAVPKMHAEGQVTAEHIDELIKQLDEASLSPVECDECNEVMGFQSSHPRGYMCCVKCHDAKEKESAAELDSKGVPMTGA